MSFSEQRMRTLVGQEAAEWFVANRDGLDAVQRRTFAAWLNTSPMHIEEYLGVALIARELPRAVADPESSIEALLARARTAESTVVRSIGPIGNREKADRADRNRWLLAATAVAALGVVGLAFLWWSADRVMSVRFATRHGEQLTRRLADDSLLRLNTDTAVTVRYARAERRVEIERGQVVFEVAHDPVRPFRVIAGSAEVLAVGTKFDVYRQRDSTLVTVLEGQVAVTLAANEPQPASASRRTVRVSAGQLIRVAARQLPLTSAPADVQRSTAWLRRQIVFEHEPLEAVTAEFNRYSATPIEIETPALRGLAISGVFAADDTESFIAFLRSLEGVRVEVTPTEFRVRGS